MRQPNFAFFLPRHLCAPALALYFALASLAIPCQAQHTARKSAHLPVSTRRFMLEKEGEKFFLESLSPAEKRIEIPKEWLIPPGIEREEDYPVDPFQYDRHVTSFPIGNGEIGLRFSSFDDMKEGSMAVAEGRDVFLIYDPKTGKIRPGLDLGTTKDRVAYRGCFHAHMVHLVISDANNDGLTDIGAIQEEIWCPEIPENDDESGDDSSDDTSVEKRRLPAELIHTIERHVYQQHLVTWYLYTPEGWKPNPEPEWIPQTYSELPLTGIVISPVDFVASVLWRTYDPKSWTDPPMYMPAYRKALMGSEQAGKKSKPAVGQAPLGRRRSER